MSSSKIHKCEHLKDEEILPFDESRILEEAQFIYSLLGKTFEKQTKIIEDSKLKLFLEVLKPAENRQHLQSIEITFPKEMKTTEIKNKISEIKNSVEKNEQRDLKCEIKNTFMIFSNMKR